MRWGEAAGTKAADERRTAAGTARLSLAGTAQAPSDARTFVSAVLARWGLSGPSVDDTTLLVSELVTNAVVHAGTAVRLECRQEGAALVVEVADQHPTRAVETVGGEDDAHRAAGRGGHGHEGHQGHGLRLVAALADEWGVTYRRDGKTVWFRLRRAAGEPVRLPEQTDGASHAEADRADTADPADTAGCVDVRAEPGRSGEWHGLNLTGKLAPAPQRAVADPRGGGPDWISHGTLSFLAESSDLLAGQTDEGQVASLAGQLLVPRFADWCAVWLVDTDTAAPPRLARVWHTREDRIDELRGELEKSPPVLEPRAPHRHAQAVPWHWPGQASAYGPGGAAVACRLVVGGRTVGSLVIGRAGLLRIADEVMGIVEDFARRVATAVLSARRYARQATISQVLQRGLLPTGEVAIPGVDTAVVYEPAGECSWAGGDFYDFFEAGEGRWRFALGDVCGNGPEAAVVTGLARPVLRLLAREGYSVPDVLDRLNREVGEQSRFLSLVYGELAPRPAADGGGIECTVASAGHPLPLVRDASGAVRAAAEPQLLLGVVESVGFESQRFILHPGETLLCVTDGVTERRLGARLFDDDDRLAAVLGECGGLDAAGTAERVRRAVHSFGDGPAVDDLALVVLRARTDG
ncbi:MAG: SpoIIE family protein phosphatase [Streptomyces sp.]|uniref:SpoIIE family protein phosphatase n=1 Tax=Streptomyces sp. TaxID=1931 RepID=UPI003D6A0DBC